MFVLLQLRDKLQAEETADGLEYKHRNQTLAQLYRVAAAPLKRFDIKQEVWVADFNWDALLQLATAHSIRFSEIPRFPAVERDLAVVLDKQIAYSRVEATVLGLRLKKLTTLSLFDVFESEKIGAGKKSLALRFTFQDAEKTLTDAETDHMMQQVMQQLEKDLAAEIRK